VDEAAAGGLEEAARRGAEEEVEGDVVLGLQVPRQVGELALVVEDGREAWLVEQLEETVDEPGEEVERPLCAPGEGVYYFCFFV
jgi:hypothetical protein